MTSPTPSDSQARSQTIQQAVRGLFHLIAIIAITVWGFMSWEMPFPGIFTGLGLLALSLLLWALFLSPKPVLATDRFGRALIELLLLAAGVGAMLGLGINWIVAVVFGLAGATLGFVTSLRSK
ncbi:DUF2568 domain-containing protein [Leucobacter aridicollis]|uniref:DUF2568 domain-containing protein n=1 Tax=Leucobacter aridicollis TaxID=283878 RepID=UPI0013C494C7|nr:DUF2568 domain-containing protein [Leucobacter aridicollis]UTX53544.1 DUF2568 domain-containing protein [Leucobacter aridicollis]